MYTHMHVPDTYVFDFDMWLPKVTGTRVRQNADRLQGQEGG